MPHRNRPTESAGSHGVCTRTRLFITTSPEDGVHPSRVNHDAKRPTTCRAKGMYDRQYLEEQGGGGYYSQEERDVNYAAPFLTHHEHIIYACTAPPLRPSHTLTHHRYAPIWNTKHMSTSSALPTCVCESHRRDEYVRKGGCFVRRALSEQRPQQPRP